jgi:hypothetical protein
VRSAVVLAQAGLLAQQEAAAAVAQAAEAAAAAEAAQLQQATLAAGPPMPIGLPASAPATPDGKRGGQLFPVGCKQHDSAAISYRRSSSVLMRQLVERSTIHSPVHSNSGAEALLVPPVWPVRTMGAVSAAVAGDAVVDCRPGCEWKVD